MTSIDHSGRPVALSWDWTNFSPVEASKFRTGSNAPAAYAPEGKTVPNSTGMGPCSAIGRLQIDTGLLGQLTKQVTFKYDDTTCLVKWTS